MVNIVVNGTAIYGSADYPITSGTVGRKVRFTFDESWNGLLKIGVFRCGGVEKEIELDDVNECEFPWEVLVHANVGKCIDVGICGLLEDKIVYPTIYTGVGNLLQGTVVTGETSVPYTPSATEQALAKAQQALDILKDAELNGHSHQNIDVLKQLSEIENGLAYAGRQLVDDRALKIFETKDDIYEAESAPTLCYVVTNRTEFVPITLEAGVQYGGHADLKDRECLSIDPLLVDFFPCEPFDITTELVKVEPRKDVYTNHTFATDGATWFRFDGCVYNNTHEPIVLDSIEYPFHGWNYFNGEEVYQLNPTINNADYIPFEYLSDVKFSTEDNFNSLQKVLSTTPAYRGGTQGLYVYNGVMYQHLVSYLNGISLNVNSAIQSSHTHPNKELLDTITEDMLGGVTVTDDGNGNVTIA